MSASTCPQCGSELTQGASPAGLCPVCLLLTGLSSDPDPDSSADAPWTMFPPGTTIGPFQIVGVRGRGGMATVYEAYDVRLERAIALKVLPPEFLHDRTFARRFQKEARVVAKLEHPNIVPIYASGIDEGIPWMSMRLLAGGNMGAFVKNKRPSLHQAVRMLRDIAGALDYAHAQGVVHRDIKPTNILLDNAGGAYVGDFGLAQMLDGAPGLTKSGMIIGTPQYMSPEQVLGSAAGPSSDVYSLGIVAYELFTGTIPFTAESPVALLMKHVREPMPSGELPPPLADAVRRAAAKDPGDRWRSADAFVTALEKAVRVSGSGRRTFDVTGPTHHTVRTRLGWAGAAGGALLTTAGIAWFVARTPERDQMPPSVSAPQGTAVVQQDKPPVPPWGPDAGPVVVPTTKTPAEPPSIGAPDPPASEVPSSSASSPTITNSAAQESQVQPQSAPPVVPVTRSSETSEVEPPPSAEPPTDVVTPPVRRRTVSPDYPPAARRAELEGDVFLEATVGTDGRVTNVEVSKPVHPLLDEAARKAVLQYEYTPGRRNGEAEPAKVRITVSFRLR